VNGERFKEIKGVRSGSFCEEVEERVTPGLKGKAGGGALVFRQKGVQFQASKQVKSACRGKGSRGNKEPPRGTEPKSEVAKLKWRVEPGGGIRKAQVTPKKKTEKGGKKGTI